VTDQRMNRGDIDFEHWSDLAENNRSEFESLRLEAIEAFISNAPADRRERLMRLQWRIDQERSLASSAMGACVRISRLMWEQVMSERGLLEHLTAAQSADSSSLVKAEVIPLVRE